MHRALVGNLHEALALLVVERALKVHDALDAVDPAFLRLAHDSQSAAWILECRSSTLTFSSGSFLCSAYMRSVMAVQAPSPASRRS